MWYIKLKPNKHIKQYTQKYYGYTSRTNISELEKHQREVRERYDTQPITKCIVKTDNGYAWRYLRNDVYVYHHITKAIPKQVFDKYYIQYIYASKVYFA